MQEGKKDCMAANGVNNLGIKGISEEDVKQHLNGYCKESEDEKGGKIKNCFCDDQEFCNTANINISPTLKILIVAFLVIRLFVNV